MSDRKDYYEALGVPRSATQAEIRTAFRRLARESHPDTGPQTQEAERAFKRISRAYETLGDAARRQQYDERYTRARFAGPGSGERASVTADDGTRYHTDMGHHSDFYQAGDPLSVADAAALTGRHPGVIRRAIRAHRLTASRDGQAYLLRRRDVERWDKTTVRRRQSATAE